MGETGPWEGHGWVFPAPENSGVNRPGLFPSPRAGCPCATKEKTRHLRIRPLTKHRTSWRSVFPYRDQGKTCSTGSKQVGEWGQAGPRVPHSCPWDSSKRHSHFQWLPRLSRRPRANMLWGTVCPSRRRVPVLPQRTRESDLVWEQGLCRSIKMQSPAGLAQGLSTDL